MNAKEQLKASMGIEPGFNETCAEAAGHIAGVVCKAYMATSRLQEIFQHGKNQTGSPRQIEPTHFKGALDGIASVVETSYDLAGYGLSRLAKRIGNICDMVLDGVDHA